jgi:hypothetical protein
MPHSSEYAGLQVVSDGRLDRPIEHADAPQPRDPLCRPKPIIRWLASTSSRTEFRYHAAPRARANSLRQRLVGFRPSAASLNFARPETATMGFDRSLREPVMAQSDQGAVIIAFKQELHRRLAGLHVLHSAPSEHDLPVGNHLEGRCPRWKRRLGRRCEILRPVGRRPQRTRQVKSSCALGRLGRIWPIGGKRVPSHALNATLTGPPPTRAP